MGHTILTIDEQQKGQGPKGPMCVAGGGMALLRAGGGWKRCPLHPLPSVYELSGLEGDGLEREEGSDLKF